MHLEEFAEGDSLLHRIDPRVKFITLMPFILLVAVLKGIELPLIGLIVSLVLVIIARLPLKKLINRLLVVNTFVLLLWLFIPFSYPGREIFSIGPLGLSQEGLLYVLSITIKTNAIVLATIAVLGTSEIFSLAHALLHLKMPEKLVYLFFFFYRYISVLHEEYTRLKRAMAIRCFHPETNMHTYRSFAYLVGMLLVRSYERSQRIYQAMLCRGFQGRFPLVRHFRLTGRDILFLTVMISITIAMAVIAIT
ncbi:MAG: cobalt ECF transporter T component CbiQ [Nitrospirae bacterium]|nr:cobalt ECF transporter T component CbiQ [Nitrospirota bacterium]